jgi:hypothetical protein
LTDDPKAKAETAFADIATSASSTVGITTMLGCIGRAYNIPDLARHFATVIEGRHTGGRPPINDSPRVEMVQRLRAQGWSRSAALWRVAKQAEADGDGDARAIFKRLDKKLRAAKS